MRKYWKNRADDFKRELDHLKLALPKLTGEDFDRARKEKEAILKEYMISVEALDSFKEHP